MKHAPPFKLAVFVDLYIPLRSDETNHQPSTIELRICLYIPLRSDETDDTWKSKEISTILYIPLRSDETHKQVHSYVQAVDFISHYVQMKREQPDLDFEEYFTLYPTTFR